MFLEACIENYSKSPMVLEYVRFDAASPLTAVSIDIRDVFVTDFTNDDPLGNYIDQLQACLLCHQIMLFLLALCHESMLCCTSVLSVLLASKPTKLQCTTHCIQKTGNAAGLHS